METSLEKQVRGMRTEEPSWSGDDFSRMDENNDTIFYSRDRLVSHVDSYALIRIESLIDQLIEGDQPIVLDLMAGWDSHWPKDRRPLKMVGLGLNENELKINKSLTEFVIHDLNHNTRLPFSDNSFDAVLNTFSVDYLIKPVEVFQEVRRVLKPGGLFLVIFSNRLFPQKAVKIWLQSSEEERLLLVEDYFKLAGGFHSPQVWVSKGGLRPEDDQYFGMGIPGDPVYALYAEKQTEGMPPKQAQRLTLVQKSKEKEIEMKEKTKNIRNTLECPYCGEKMKKWAVPQGPFTEWENEFMYICFNDACPYLIRGWEVMARQGNRGISYRCMYYPEKEVCLPVPIFSLQALRESIVEE
jgi:ubiquinone/menaquinone biosynthesis C-methylase UbiE